jgi:hypothetical protein
MDTMTKKITLATFKAFIKKNKDNLFILNETDFDGMTDCVTDCKGTPRKAEFKDPANEYALPNTLGIKGVWLVLDSRDYFKPYEDEVFKGIEVSNSCGRFIVGIIK